jgi:hypothetical protein
LTVRRGHRHRVWRNGIGQSVQEPILRSRVTTTPAL